MAEPDVTTELSNTENPPIVESPPNPPDEEVDSRGVSYKNVAAEWQRKAEEAERGRILEAERNRAYQEELGRIRSSATPAQPASNVPPGLEAFDEPTRASLLKWQQSILSEAEKIARSTGYQLMTQVSHQAALQQDPEIMAEAQKQFGLLKNNPIWASANETLLTDRAIAEAKSVVISRRSEAEKKKALADAQRLQAEMANLPRTTRGEPMPSADDKKKFIDSFKADPQNQEMHALFCRGQGFSPTSEQGRQFLEKSAEEAWGGINFGGKMETAVQILGGNVKANFTEKGNQ